MDSYGKKCKAFYKIFLLMGVDLCPPIRYTVRVKTSTFTEYNSTHAVSELLYQG